MPESSLVVAMAWQSGLLPLAVAAAAVLAAGARAGRPAVQAAALAIGVLASFFAALHAQWSPLPQVALDWLPWIVAGGLPAVVAVHRTGNAVARHGLRLVLSLGAAALVLGPAVASFGPGKTAWAVAATGVLIALAWAVLTRGERSSRMQPLLLAVVAGGAGLAMMLDSSASAGRLAGALAAALVGLALAGRLRLALAPAATGLGVLVLGVLLAQAVWYGEFPVTYVGLIAAALLAEPLVAGGAEGGPRRRLAAAVLTVLPVAATVVLAVKAMQEMGGY